MSESVARCFGRRSQAKRISERVRRHTFHPCSGRANACACLSSLQSAVNRRLGYPPRTATQLARARRGVRELLLTLQACTSESLFAHRGRSLAAVALYFLRRTCVTEVWAQACLSSNVLYPLCEVSILDPADACVARALDSRMRAALQDRGHTTEVKRDMV